MSRSVSDRRRTRLRSGASCTLLLLSAFLTAALYAVLVLRYGAGLSTGMGIIGDVRADGLAPEHGAEHRTASSEAIRTESGDARNRDAVPEQQQDHILDITNYIGSDQPRK